MLASFSTRPQVAYLADHADDADDKHLQKARTIQMPIDAKMRIASLLKMLMFSSGEVSWYWVLVITVLCDQAQEKLRRTGQNQRQRTWLCDCAE